MNKIWFITGISSGFGLEITRLVLRRGDVVVGTVRHTESTDELAAEYPETLLRFTLDVRDREALKSAIATANKKFNRIDVLVNNAGYGLFGAAEEVSDSEIDAVIGTNLIGSITALRAVLPIMRKQKSGRIIQISSYGGQVAYAGNSLYHATKFGIEGFCESVAQEMRPFGVLVTIVEPGGARTDFRYRSAHVAELNPAYEGNPAHAFLKMLNPKNGLAAGDPVRMAQRIVETADKTDAHGQNAAPLRIVLGSQALHATLDALQTRINELKTQENLARSTDIETA